MKVGETTVISSDNQKSAVPRESSFHLQGCSLASFQYCCVSGDREVGGEGETPERLMGGAVRTRTLIDEGCHPLWGGFPQAIGVHLGGASKVVDPRSPYQIS